MKNCRPVAMFGVPVLMHFQHQTYNTDIHRFYKLLEKFPAVNFIGHAQTFWGNIDAAVSQKDLYPKGKIVAGGITDRYLRDYPNMYGDLSAGSGLNAMTRDEDHARWELRYARRALGLLVAERDALDDRTPALVADALEAALERDPHVAADKVDVALAQFNVRLSAYREAFRARNPKEAVGLRLGRELLSFSSAVPKERDLAIAEAATILQRLMSDAAEALRRSFGEAKLPDDLPPSQMARG